MPVIPITKGTKPSSPQAQQPSETSLLMALAEMHKQGKFAPPAKDTK